MNQKLAAAPSHAWGGSAGVITMIVIAALSEYGVTIGPNTASLATLLAFWLVAYLKRKGVIIPMPGEPEAPSEPEAK